jgi:hypothetical protein
VSACERGWTHPVVVAILEGQCQDLAQREAQTLQRARLHVLERAQRWKEAYHYAIFHGHVAKSLAYMVRAGRQADVIQMVLRQTGLAGGGKCVPVCTELVTCNQPGMGMRLALYCAFGSYDPVTPHPLPPPPRASALFLAAGGGLRAAGGGRWAAAACKRTGYVP